MWNFIDLTVNKDSASLIGDWNINIWYGDNMSKNKILGIYHFDWKRICGLTHFSKNLSYNARVQSLTNDPRTENFLSNNSISFS